MMGSVSQGGRVVGKCGMSGSGGHFTIDTCFLGERAVGRGPREEGQNEEEGGRTGEWGMSIRRDWKARRLHHSLDRPS